MKFKTLQTINSLEETEIFEDMSCHKLPSVPLVGQLYEHRK